MDISEARRSSSSQLIDAVAHDAKLVKKDEHVVGSPSTPSGEQMFRHASDPSLPKTYDMRAAYDNDVANLGLAKALYGGDFEAAEATTEHRSGVAQGAIDKFAQYVTGNARVALQAHADEGFFAAEMANKAVSYLPKEQQAAAAQKYLEANYGPQLKNDIGFATGAKYNAFLHAKGDDAGVTAEMHHVGQRAKIDNPCVGTIAG